MEGLAGNKTASSTGYLHPRYAESLAEFGVPRALPCCGGWILQREIPGFPYRDGMGVYPLFCCRDWSKLGQDVEALADELITLALVTDPFGDYDAGALEGWFDLVIHYKDHFTVDLSLPAVERVCPHHRRNARKAFKTLAIGRCEHPADALTSWVALYDELIEHHRIRSMATFSRASFAQQLRVPGVAAFEAVCRGRTVGMLLWYERGPVAYYHLGAFSETGYRTHASFGLFRFAIEHFAKKGLRWIGLGAGAGASGGASGLTRFKKGWATGTRPVHFCGRVLEPSAYQAVTGARGGVPATDYFPAYRKGEFD